MKANSIAFRLAVGAVIWIGAALMVSGFVLATLFGDHVERGFDRRITVLLDSLIAVAEVGEDGALALSRTPAEPRFGQPYSGWYWQIAASLDTVHRSRSLWDQALSLPQGPVRAGALRSYRVGGPQNQTLKVVERAVVLPGDDAPYRFAVAADLAQLEAEVRPFNWTLGLSLGVLWLVLMAAVAAQVRFGLRPLDRLRVALADVRLGRAERLEGAFPAEVAPLVEETNALLDQIGRVVERARTHVGNLAHAVRTPLSVMVNEAAGAEGALAETVRRETDSVRRWIDHHLMRARAAAAAQVIGARSEVAPVLEDLRRTLARMHAERGLRIDVEAAADLHFRGDRQDLEEIVGNVMDNGCKWARAAVRVGASAMDGRLTITVEDDGPGLPAERREEALRRGARLDESVPGSGLGLAIVGEIAELYDGALQLGNSDLGGLRAALVLPAAEGG
jgi:signal transduction histidine kinase